MDTSNKLEIPQWLCKEVWDEYVVMRKKIKKQMTPYAEKLAIQKLESLKAQGEDPNEVLKQSIFQSWKGLFAVKEPERRVEKKKQTENDLIALGASLNLQPRPGEGWPEFKDRVYAALEKKNTFHDSNQTFPVSH